MVFKRTVTISFKFQVSRGKRKENRGKRKAQRAKGKGERGSRFSFRCNSIVEKIMLET
jgi:hypothetical protein